MGSLLIFTRAIVDSPISEYCSAVDSSWLSVTALENFPVCLDDPEEYGTYQVSLISRILSLGDDSDSSHHYLTIGFAGRARQLSLGYRL